MFGNIFEEIGKGMGEIIKAPVDIVTGLGKSLTDED